ncbi:DoxX family protein [Paenibacillus sp. Leaf72]|uniref:DoxX family protein n=1 Tax=Paenibacillus sp. Leaf72 TaxID=1736234 RepID=UPI0009D6C66B|nr:DoxX family protein [Paenibacillus sp. Leaf72]
MTIWIIEGLLAAMFLMAGLGKTFGSSMHVESFRRWRLPQWFRVVTGLVELAGAALLIIGFWKSGFAIAGALLLAVTALGGILTHLRVKDGIKETSTIVILGILAGVLLFLLY